METGSVCISGTAEIQVVGDFGLELYLLYLWKMMEDKVMESWT